MDSQVGQADWIFLLVLQSTNMLGQGPLVTFVRRRHGESAGTVAVAVVQAAYALAFTLWASIVWGFFWWGAGSGTVALLTALGTWLYRRRGTMRSVSVGSTVTPEPREQA
ncbi:hypothetical protein [Frankia sp. AiPa1]|uniref:hypothetical protein n=1 Tax=Frankia sp. AiPa1 TaxID=573492 RepID=UPI00202BA2C4|nr:hypothetical protein [Frankia sp. AiPa1]MCL9761906.1 hypothetical protein [Frankia sp. AiPa1]